MNKYLATVRVRGNVMRTAIFADSIIHARLLLQYAYGMDSIAVSPTLVKETQDTLLDNTIAPKPPMTPQQERVNALKQNVERSKDQLHAERERQHQQREAERKQKALQRQNAAL